MKIRSLACLLILPCVLYACNSNQEKAEVKKEVAMPAPAKETPDYKHLDFDAKKDLVCGMPVSAGISDTIHYKDKLYGFCSKGCKDEFEKDPLAYVKTLK